MEKVRQENKPLHEQARKLRTERDALVKAPQFDQDAYLKKSSELGALRDRIMTNKEKAFASVAVKFTLEERKVLLVMRHMHCHGHHRGDMHSQHPGDGGNPAHGPQMKAPSSN